MKAIFYDPYLDSVGGGERYVLTIAENLLKNKWEVYLADGSEILKDKFESRFQLNLSGLKFISGINRFVKRWHERDYDLMFWLSDGSIPLMFAKNNILHFQVPFHYVNGKNFLNKIKLKNIHHTICNSLFTKKFIDREYGINSEVIYPPVDTENLKPGKKENIIFSVGRFSQLLQAKRQDILVDVFKEMIKEGLKDWKLVLAGGSDVGVKDFVINLRQKSAGFNIEIIENAEFKVIKNLYSRAKIFWNASGFGVDEDKNPEKVEHFGIVIVEAMSAGCVPVAVGKGGINELITHGESGFLWETKEELKEMTFNLIKEEKGLKKISEKVQEMSKKYAIDNFCRQYDSILV